MSIDPDYGRASGNRPSVYGDLSKESIFDRGGVIGPETGPIPTNVGGSGETSGGSASAWRGEWNGSNSYSSGDIVRGSSGSLFIVKEGVVPDTGITPEGNPSIWELMIEANPGDTTVVEGGQNAGILRIGPVWGETVVDWNPEGWGSGGTDKNVFLMSGYEGPVPGWQPSHSYAIDDSYIMNENGSWEPQARRATTGPTEPDWSGDREETANNITSYWQEQWNWEWEAEVEVWWNSVIVLNGQDRYLFVSNSGITATELPAWNFTVGSTTADGTAGWYNAGKFGVWTPNTTYVIEYDEAVDRLINPLIWVDSVGKGYQLDAQRGHATSGLTEPEWHSLGNDGPEYVQDGEDIWWRYSEGTRTEEFRVHSLDVANCPDGKTITFVNQDKSYPEDDEENFWREDFYIGGSWDTESSSKFPEIYCARGESRTYIFDAEDSVWILVGTNRL